jgi:hypothetical protein
VGQLVGGRKWPVMVSTVPLGRHQYRVVRPATVPRFAGLYEGRLGAPFCLDKKTGCYGMWAGTEVDNDAAPATYRRAGAAEEAPFTLLGWNVIDGVADV